ncbi:MAG TPA: PAS domain S-box protein, partial [Anaerolineales bacterium]|nr:PAS domain S-box protein [Anaerolineales bacterium]
MSLPASILIIDDDRGMCETLGDVLRLKGYIAEAAGGGREALEKLRARPFDGAVVDIKLPDISGLDLLKELKATSPDTEVVFITGYASLTTAIEAINGAAFAYLVKPFEMEHLLATLEKALEKQRLARALRESEGRYRLITENINDAIFLADLEGRLVFGNRRGEEITGYLEKEFAGRPLFSLLTPEGAQQASARLEAVRAGDKVSPIFEAQIIRKDGSRVWVEAAVTNVVKDGAVVGRLGVARDITERKRLQEQVIQAEKLATLGQLIAGIAHELNNPLAAMVGHAQMLRLGQQDPKVAARADRIVDAAQRATRIVRNFLTAARRHHPERTAVSINDIVTKTLELLAYQLRVNNIEVESALAPDLPQIGGDPHQLQQVVLNLVNNAIQAMAPSGQGRLRIASSLSPDRSMIRLAVTDNGPGIPPEHLPRVLEPFFTTKPQGEGTGLGLAIAQGIVTD